jgi:hypothetical protein
MNDKPKIRVYARLGMGLAASAWDVGTKSPATAIKTVKSEIEAEGLAATSAVLAAVKGGKA